MSDITKVKALVLYEYRGDKTAEINAETSALARRLAGDDWAGIVVGGPAVDGLCSGLAALCPRLYALSADHLADFSPAAWLPALTGAAAQLEPEIIISGHTPWGMDLMPALAARLSAALASDVTAVGYEPDGSLTAIRPVYGGKLAATLSLAPAPVRALTLRPGSVEPLEAGQAGPIIALDAGQAPASLARRFLELVPASGGVDLTKAKIIVSVGRGIEGPENMDIIEELADALGAEIGCSRPVADLGWLTKDRQVGVSGQTVKPKVYLALGISGAFQHQAGMSGAETIIAVNRDAEAPIFDIAHYGLVGDLFDLVPALTDVWAE